MSDNFKIISEGKDLSYPMLRILTIMAYSFVFGLALGGAIMKHLLTGQ